MQSSNEYGNTIKQTAVGTVLGNAFHIKVIPA